MSLRTFHIVFVIVSVALSLFVATWGFREFSHERNLGALLLAGIFLATAFALIVYGKRVYVKLKELP